MSTKIIDTYFLSVIPIMKNIFLLTLLLVQLNAVHDQSTNFSEAKALAKHQDYFDMNDNGTTHCGGYMTSYFPVGRIIFCRILKSK